MSLQVRVFPKKEFNKIGDFAILLNNVPKDFDAVCIEEFEPCCPFCGKELQNAHCDCDIFGIALQEIMSLISKKENFELSLEHPGEPHVRHCQIIKPENLTSRIMSSKECLLNAFDNSIQKDNFEYSVGSLDADVLEFLGHKIGDKEIYHFTIKNFTPILPERKVCFYTPNVEYRQLLKKRSSQNVGEKYHIHHELPYETFLKLLRSPSGL